MLVAGCVSAASEVCEALLFYVYEVGRMDLDMIDFETEFLDGSVVVVKARGQLDESTRKYFFECISDLLQESGIDNGVSQHVIIECHGLGYLSSAGIAALLTARNRIRKGGGKISFTHLSSAIVKTLELTKLNKLLAIYPTTEELLLKTQV